jgi:hypothetical protein
MFRRENTMASVATAVRVEAIHVDIHTTRNDKDREVSFTYLIHQPGVGAISDPLTVGHGEVWPDGENNRTYRIKLKKPFPYADRLKYALRVTYSSSDGDPNWIGRLSARAEATGGQQFPVLGSTGDFEMGHLDGHPERKERDFQFNL